MFNRYYFLSFFALSVSMLSLSIDVMIEVGGIRARTLDTLWFWVFVGISVVVHLAFLLSPLFRYVTGGKRHVWTICAVPMLFLYSLGATLVGQSSYIESQASQIKQARVIKAKQLQLVDKYQDNSDKYSDSAAIQQRYDYAKRSNVSIDKSNVSLDKAAAVLKDASKSAAAANVTNAQAVELPLRILNSVLPSPISVKTFLIFFYTLMSFCLIMLGYFFSELFLTLQDKSDHARDMSGTTSGHRDIKELTSDGTLTDEDSLAAIDAYLSAGKPGGEQWTEADINRAWMDTAHRRVYGKARKGSTLDKFIAPTKAKVNQKGFFKFKKAI